ncbi:bifunctional protein tyrosine phosphatase family protein/NAD(P)/FAD-dependent oxidoreductase [Chenggangzhangella methanolivorans]|uniref:TIGR01244 family phosphatase n=1 Tax=Chenggangzhangella methanolivorans TaxID=1437009 RepID=A0A9E6RCZ5_9HYPH|nr:bifunctional protein tyrosine phosphatase family protein/NAD(P)/FAD-dependent oxidoreductase [Chenggangzhangella methanolivorans]QZO02022.1 TIGR01244 family phosphatase [Chenggangzhangella methanolivorans]
MQAKTLTDDLSVSPQLTVADVAEAKAAGFRSIIINRPDGEAADQPSHADIETAARQAGMETRYIPVVLGKLAKQDVEAFANAMSSLPKPVIGFCKSGTRTATLWAMSEAGNRPSQDIEGAAKAAGYDVSAALTARLGESDRGASKSNTSRSHDVVIVGAGASGIALAASILSRKPGLDIAIIDAADAHYYQPGWTMVGRGVFSAAETRRDMASLIPNGVKWIKERVASFQPDAKTVTLESGAAVSYRKLVVAPGLKLNWSAIEGLEETLGKNGVTSNYRYDLAPYTWELVQQFRGGNALFTQPPMPIKCAGAPQKAMYLSCDHWLATGALGKSKVEFLNAGPVLFGVADYVPPLMEYVKRYGIGLSFGHNLVKIDGAAKRAWFKTTPKEGEPQIVERSFDMIHVTPPQSSPDFVKSSPLANEAGWVDVDPGTLRHVRYPDIYSLGDAMGASNAKTAAAARKQAPVVAENLLRDMGSASTSQPAIYDGYGSCPLTVERGKVILAEFAYGGRRVPSFPKWFIDDLKPSKAAWMLKERVLPKIYWQAMLKGRELMAKPQHTTAQAAE